MPDRSREGDVRRRFLATVAAQQLVREAVSALRGIAVMPLKGVLLQRLVYADPSERPLSDADLLVPAEAFDAACARLERAGFRLVKAEAGGRERTYEPPRAGLLLDLHAEVFPRGQFRLEGKALFARGHPDSSLFGVPVIVPAPLDLYAHLVGHAAMTWLYAHRLHQPRDFWATARALGLHAGDVAAHLDACGLARAARYVLPLVDRAAGDPFARDVLRRIPRDPVGTLLAGAVARTLPHLPVRRGVGLLPPNVLHRDPRVVAVVVARGLARRAKGLTSPRRTA